MSGMLWGVSNEPHGEIAKIIIDHPALPVLKHCVGGIERTHIPVMICVEDQHSHWCRKLRTTKIMMCCVDCDTRVRYALTSWEGCAHVMRLFKDAHTSHYFTMPHDKTLLADHGYSNENGVLAPYQKVKYLNLDGSNCYWRIQCC